MNKEYLAAYNALFAEAEKKVKELDEIVEKINMLVESEECFEKEEATPSVTFVMTLPIFDEHGKYQTIRNHAAYYGTPMETINGAIRFALESEPYKEMLKQTVLSLPFAESVKNRK